jgi:hypothetical protein
MTLLAHAISEYSESWGVRAGEGNVEPPIIVVVEVGEGSCVLLAVDPADEGFVGKSIGASHEKAISLVPAQGITSEGGAANLALFDSQLKIEKGRIPMFGISKVL